MIMNEVNKVKVVGNYMLLYVWLMVVKRNCCYLGCAHLLLGKQATPKKYERVLEH